MPGTALGTGDGELMKQRPSRFTGQAAGQYNPSVNRHVLCQVVIGAEEQWFGGQ